MDGWTDGWMDGWMDGGTDRWMNGRTDRQTDRQSCVVKPTVMPPHLPPSHTLARPSDLEYLNEEIMMRGRERRERKGRTTDNINIHTLNYGSHILRPFVAPSSACAFSSTSLLVRLGLNCCNNSSMNGRPAPYIRP